VGLARSKGTISIYKNDRIVYAVTKI
jgi:hypothetical protein